MKTEVTKHGVIYVLGAYYFECPECKESKDNLCDYSISENKTNFIVGFKCLTCGCEYKEIKSKKEIKQEMEDDQND